MSSQPSEYSAHFPFLALCSISSKEKDPGASVGPQPALKGHLLFCIPLLRASHKNDTRILWGHSKTSAAWDAACRIKWDEGPFQEKYTQVESEDWPFCLINEIASALWLFAETNDYYEILNSQGMPVVQAEGGWNHCSALWWIWNKSFLKKEKEGKPFSPAKSFESTARCELTRH